MDAATAAVGIYQFTHDGEIKTTAEREGQLGRDSSCLSLFSEKYEKAFISPRIGAVRWVNSSPRLLGCGPYLSLAVN